MWKKENIHYLFHIFILYIFHTYTHPHWYTKTFGLRLLVTIVLLVTLKSVCLPTVCMNYRKWWTLTLESHHSYSIIVVSAIIYKKDELGSKKKRFSHHFHKHLSSMDSMPGNILMPVFQLKGSCSYFIINKRDKSCKMINTSLADSHWMSI